jgi:hypothetical protein
MERPVRDTDYLIQLATGGFIGHLPVPGEIGAFKDPRKATIFGKDEAQFSCEYYKELFDCKVVKANQFIREIYQSN